MPRWIFTDPTLATSYSFDVNPKEGGSPQYKKNIAIQNTLAPGGKTLLYEGADEVQNLEFSGIIREQSQYDAMVLWFNKRHQIQVQDDLGRTYMVYITEFSPKRERSIQRHWKHSYTVRAIILDWTDG